MHQIKQIRVTQTETKLQMSVAEPDICKLKHGTQTDELAGESPKSMK